MLYIPGIDVVVRLYVLELRERGIKLIGAKLFAL